MIKLRVTLLSVLLSLLGVFTLGGMQLNADAEIGTAFETPNVGNADAYTDRLTSLVSEESGGALLVDTESRLSRYAEKSTQLYEAALREACPGYNEDYVLRMTEKEQVEMRTFYEEGYVFYLQNCSILKYLPYGDDTFGQCGCGPTVTAALIANLAGVPVTPEDMRTHAMNMHAYVPNAGTTYGFIMDTTAAYGIKATHVTTKDEVCKALSEGKLVLVTMGPGDFTLGAHYMLYRGITEDGKILIADSYSYEFSRMEWEWDDLAGQLKRGYWIFEMATE